MPTTASIQRTEKLPGGVQGLKKRTKELLIKVGVLKGTGTYPNGATIAEVAFWNEFGTKRIPARPFLRPSIIANHQLFKNLMGQGISKILLGKSTVSKVSAVLGIRGQKMVQDKITQISQPGNAPRTIDEKGSSSPLIDTGKLRQSISWQRVE